MTTQNRQKSNTRKKEEKRTVQGFDLLFTLRHQYHCVVAHKDVSMRDENDKTKYFHFHLMLLNTTHYFHMTSLCFQRNLTIYE